MDQIKWCIKSTENVLNNIKKLLKNKSNLDKLDQKTIWIFSVSYGSLFVLGFI